MPHAAARQPGGRGRGLLRLSANWDAGVRYREGPEAHLAPDLVDTHKLPADERVGLCNVAFGLVLGSLSAEGEYIRAAVDLPGGSDAAFDRWKVHASYFLTGEHRSYSRSGAKWSRLRPKRNFGKGGGLGAWEAAARYSTLDLNAGSIRGGRRMIVAEPEELARGKRFQERVQDDFRRKTRDGEALPEARVSFAAMENIRKKSGRMDILITELGDFVTILEIKATDWDKIKPANIRRNLWRHQKQLLTYVDKYLKIDRLDVCVGIIYPRPPKKPGLRELVESRLEESYGVPAYWYSEIQTEGDGQMEEAE